jgi:hypothetical protein
MFNVGAAGWRPAMFSLPLRCFPRSREVFPGPGMFSLERGDSRYRGEIIPVAGKFSPALPVGQDAQMILGLRRTLDDQAFE